MTRFKSRQVNLDPEPWVNTVTGDRVEVGQALDGIAAGHGLVETPRPEFEPTRDPLPWATDVLGNSRASQGGWGKVWAPRRELFDTPVNRVLEDFRGSALKVEFWVSQLALDPKWLPTHWTTDEIEHARKVLTRLAGWKA